MRRLRSSSIMSGVVLFLVAALEAGATVLLVSPGSAERFDPVSTACPTFSWSGVAVAAHYELAIFHVGKNDASTRVLTERLPAGATSWTPSAEECLAPGKRYAWSVRAINSEDQGSWSEARLFKVPVGLDDLELAQALDVVRKYLATGGILGDERQLANPGFSRAPETPQSLPTGDTRTLAAATLASAVAAIHAEQSDPSGDTAGLVGVSHSPAGAGMIAANASAAGGADLILDGSSQSATDSVVTESSIDRSSSNAEVFNIQNSGAGTMTLQVDGIAVLAGPNSVGTTELASNAVTSAIILDGAVSQADIAGGAVGTDELKADAVTGAKIAPNTITASDIVPNTITGGEIASNTVTRAELADEPGAAYRYSATDVVLDLGVATNILQRTITTPSSGFVVATGRANFQIEHTGGFASEIFLSVSATSGVLNAGNLTRHRITSPDSFSAYRIPLPVTHVFTESTAGTYTYYLVAERDEGTGSRVMDSSLSLLFVPTAYGTVSP